MSELMWLVSWQNYFSCEVAGLDEATGLGQGEFQDPTTEALQSAGHELQFIIGIDPFSSVSNRNYSNTALSFAGNVQVSSHLLYLLIKQIDDAPADKRSCLHSSDCASTVAQGRRCAGWRKTHVLR